MFFVIRFRELVTGRSEMSRLFRAMIIPYCVCVYDDQAQCDSSKEGVDAVVTTAACDRLGYAFNCSFFVNGRPKSTKKITEKISKQGRIIYMCTYISLFFFLCTCRVYARKNGGPRLGNQVIST